MTIDRKLLEILVCPITKQPLALLDSARMDKVNELIAQGKLQTLDGQTLDAPLREALVTQNHTTIYQVDGNVPVMLEARSIPCEQISGW